jgi:hypothetical protein
MAHTPTGGGTDKRTSSMSTMSIVALTPAVGMGGGTGGGIGGGTGGRIDAMSAMALTPSGRPYLSVFPSST